jgi:transposase-like protein
MNLIEINKPAVRRHACNGMPVPRQRAGIAAGARAPRSARSEARAANAVIDQYARGVSTTRAASSVADEMHSEVQFDG